MSGICFKIFQQSLLGLLANIKCKIFQHLHPHSPDKRGKEIWEKKVRMMTIVEAGTGVWEFLILFSGFKYSVNEKLKINKKERMERKGCSLQRESSDLASMEKE